MLSKFIVISVFLVSLTTPAFGFFWSDDEVKEEKVFHYTFKFGELASYKDLHAIIEERKQEVVVFKSVIEEKNTEINELDTILQNQYGVHPSRMYSYNSTNLTIYVAVDKNGEQVLLPHRIFVTPEEGSTFVKILMGKQTAIQQVALLNTIFEEKRAELDNAQSVMQSFFMIDPNKKYVLDEKEQKIYELRPAKTKAEIKAEKEAYRKNKELARKKAEAAENAKKAAEKKAREAEKAKKAALKAEKKRLEAEVDKSENVLDDCRDQLKIQQSRLEDSKDELVSLEKKLARIKGKEPSVSNSKKIKELTTEISKCKKIISLREKNVTKAKNNITIAEKNINIFKKRLDDFCKSNKM